jgi:nucleoside-diphosphate-sugar epimerase
MPVAERSWCIAGCGYVGARLARRRLEQGDEVVALRRDREALAELEGRLPGLRTQSAKIGALPAELAASELVVLAAPPGVRCPEEEGALAASLSDATRLIYLSTTGVYPEAGGAEVDESWPTCPISERGRRRLAVEERVLSIHPNTAVLRVPGIYGPGRGVQARMAAGSYRLIGSADTATSRIHVDDLVSAIECLADRAELPHRVFNVADEAPVPSREHALGVATRLGLPPPPAVDAESVASDVRAMLGADRRVVAPRLRALGWRPRYPSWREGLEQCLAEEAGI